MDIDWGNPHGIGITDYAQEQLGDIVFFEVKDVGAQIKSEEIFGAIETVKTVSDLFMPVDGIIAWSIQNWMMRQN